MNKNVGYVYQNLLDKRKTLKPEFKIGDLVIRADLKKTFSKFDTNNWSLILDENTESVNDMIPSYKIDDLPERFNEVHLKKTKLTMKENNSLMKKLAFNP